MSASLVPAGRALRLTAAGPLASRSMLAATCGWLALLAAVYAADAGPPRPAMAFTAVFLFPVAAWAAAAQLAAGSDDLRAVLAAAGGRGRALTVDVVVALLWVLGAAVTGVAAPLLFDPHQAPAGHYLLGALLHLLCGAAGAALALLLHAFRVSRGVQMAVVLLGAALSGRLGVVPPLGPVLAVWSTDRQPSALTAAWSLAGPLLVTVVLLLGTAAVRRRG